MKCVLNKGNQILLIRNNYGSTSWTFPGGAVKKHEDFESAIIRELQEELGVTVTQLHNIGSFISEREYKKDHITIFSATLDNTTLKTNPLEIMEARWFNATEMPMLSEVAQKIYAAYQQSIN